MTKSHEYWNGYTNACFQLQEQLNDLRFIIDMLVTADQLDVPRPELDGRTIREVLEQYDK